MGLLRLIEHDGKERNFTCALIFMSSLYYCWAQSMVFTCPAKSNSDAPLPELPTAYTSNVKLNYISEHRTVEVRQVVDKKREAIEFTSAKRHVKYINLPDKNTVLKIQYSDEDEPSCEVKKSPGKGPYFLEPPDNGPNDILKIVLETIEENVHDFHLAGHTFEDGIPLYRWEGCFKSPKINISISFSPNSWTPFQEYSLAKVDYYIQKIEAEMDGNKMMGAVFSRLDPREPADDEFQPPEQVYCEGWRTDVPIPNITNYFSFDAELVVYESAEGIRPYISQRKVFYDYPAGIARTDFYDFVAESGDIFTKIRALAKTVIHDFKAGAQYTIDPVTGNCTFDEYPTTFSVLAVTFPDTNDMPTAKEYFYLNKTRTSYNGKYETRGIQADVFTGEVPIYKGSSIVNWYFSTNNSQIVEDVNVVENVLLRMVVRPKSGVGKQNMAVINFYNFLKKEPEEYMFDVTACYDEFYSKHLVLTFTGQESLKGSEKLVQQLIHTALQEAMGIDRRRIFIIQIAFKGVYTYAEFKLLDNPPVSTIITPVPPLSLDEAYAKLKEAITDGKLSVSVETPTNIVVLKPEPNGLNEFSGDRNIQVSEAGYKEASVIGMAFGMLFLGIVLGGMLINLIVSRKFGVSLFQKKSYGNRPFDNPLNESAM